MKNLLLAIGLFISFSVTAQNKEYKIYYGPALYRCDESVASYYRIITLDAVQKPVGIIRDYFLTGELYGEGYISQLDNENAERDHKEGKWTNYYKNGKKQREGTFVKGVVNGTYRTWYEDGKPQFQGDYLAGKEQGLHKEWHRNGKLFSETMFKDGSYDGPRRLYHENGELAYKENFKGQKRDGYAASFHSNGILHWERNYVNGIMTEKCVPLFDANENGFTACNELFGQVAKSKWKLFTHRYEWSTDWGSFSAGKNGITIVSPSDEQTFVCTDLKLPGTSIHSIATTFKVPPAGDWDAHPKMSLIWNVKDSGNYYAFSIHGQAGTFTVTAEINNITHYFYDAYGYNGLPDGPDVNRSGTRNLMVVRNGNDLDLYMDNIKVHTIKNETFSNSAAGVQTSGEKLEVTEFIYATKKK